MKPMEFVCIDEDEPVAECERVAVLQSPIIICDGPDEYEVLSYYYAPEYGRMCLDIARIDPAGKTFDSTGATCCTITDARRS